MMIRKLAAAASLFALGLAAAWAQAPAEPIRIGFLSVRTGALAAGGKQMEEGITLFLKGGAPDTPASARNDAWSEARLVLLSARERIVAPNRPGGHGLPREAEAILLFLGGDVPNAVSILQNGPRSPWSAKILATMAAAKP